MKSAQKVRSLLVAAQIGQGCAADKCEVPVVRGLGGRSGEGRQLAPQGGAAAFGPFPLLLAQFLLRTTGATEGGGGRLSFSSVFTPVLFEI